jgi:iron(III) transport system permease protein
LEAHRLGRLAVRRGWGATRRLALPFQLEATSLVYLVLFFLVANLVILPIAMLLLSSVNLGPITKAGGATLAFFVQGWTSPTTYLTIVNTLIFGFGSVLLAVLIGGFFAFMVERTDMPFKSFVYISIALTIAMPAMLYGIAWVLLLSDKIGISNLILLNLFGAKQGFLTSWAGIGLAEAPINAHSASWRHR